MTSAPIEVLIVDAASGVVVGSQTLDLIRANHHGDPALLEALSRLESGATSEEPVGSGEFYRLRVKREERTN